MFFIIGGDGREYGPLTAEGVWQCLREGRATPQSLVRREGDVRHLPIGTLVEFRGAGPALAWPPKVWLWQRVYCGAMLALFLLVAGGGLVLFVRADEIAEPGLSATEIRIAGGIYGVMGFLLAIPFAVGLMLKGKPWHWVYQSC